MADDFSDSGLRNKLKELEAAKKAFGTQPEDSFLDAIMQNESSGGIDTEHDRITAGLHKGDQAIGRFGLLPNTIKEMAVRNPDDVRLKNLSKMDGQGIKSVLEADKDLEMSIARKLAGHILKRQQGDEDRAAYAWFQGHNLYPDKISKEDLAKSEYNKRFNESKKLIKKNTK